MGNLIEGAGQAPPGVDDMTDAELEVIIQGSISLGEATTRYSDKTRHVDLTDPQKAEMIKFVIAVWRIQEFPALLAVAKEADDPPPDKPNAPRSRMFEVEIDREHHALKKTGISDRQAVDDLKPKVIGMVTPKRFPTYPIPAHSYPKRAMHDLVERKKGEKPQPPKSEMFGGRL